MARNIWPRDLREQWNLWVSLIYVYCSQPLCNLRTLKKKRAKYTGVGGGGGGGCGCGRSEQEGITK